jgi:hypothetical protein
MDTHYEALFVQALALTIASETAVVVALVYALNRRNPNRPSIGRVLAASFFASLATLPYLWFVLPAFVGPALVRTIGGEIGIVLVETAVYRLMLGVSVRQSLLLSTVANAVSIVVGLVVMPP